VNEELAVHHRLELAEVIRDLRDEVERAVVAGAGEALRFELGPIELEVTVGLERSGAAGAKVRFIVAELGASGTLSATDTQRIKLVLTPHLGDGSAGTYVSGRSVPGER
jgi:hypothetical protein